MKHISLLLFALVLVFSSCDRACKDMNCVHGTCEDGTCDCEPGYTGELCDQLICSPDCGEHGTCVGGVCECDAGWGGVACDTLVCSPACVNGDCISGSCSCDGGWEGPACDVRSTTKFVDTYSVTQGCGGVNSSYSATIVESATDVQWVEIHNFYALQTVHGISDPVMATVTLDVINIPTQTLTNGTTTLIFSGYGGRNPTGEINITFTVTYPSTSYTCGAAFLPF